MKYVLAAFVAGLLLSGCAHLKADVVDCTVPALASASGAIVLEVEQALNGQNWTMAVEQLVEQLGEAVVQCAVDRIMTDWSTAPSPTMSMSVGVLRGHQWLESRHAKIKRVSAGNGQ